MRNDDVGFGLFLVYLWGVGILFLSVFCLWLTLLFGIENFAFAGYGFVDRVGRAVFLLIVSFLAIPLSFGVIHDFVKNFIEKKEFKKGSVVVSQKRLDDLVIQNAGLKLKVKNLQAMLDRCFKNSDRRKNYVN